MRDTLLLLLKQKIYNMIDRTHIEKILKLNGLGPESPDEEIKQLLISARWHENDVETALVILRKNPHENTHKIGGVQDVLRTEAKIAPETLNALLGIDVEVNKVTEHHHAALERVYYKQILTLVAFSILFASLFLLFVII